METICVAALKGGVGKTSTALALSSTARARGLRVLLVDLDKQGTLTCSMRIRGRITAERSSWGALTGRTRAKDCIVCSERGDIIPYSPALRDVESSIPKTRLGGIDVLSKSLAAVGEDYDLAVVDTPPDVGPVVENGLYAASLAVIPTTADYHSTATFRPFMKEITALREANGRPERIATYLNMWDSRTKIGKAYREMLEAECKESGTEFLGTVRRSVALQDAQARGADILEESPSHPMAQDLRQAAEAALRLADLID